MQRTGLLTLTLFLLLLIAWKWSVIEALARPSLVQVGAIAGQDEVEAPGLLYPRLAIRAPVSESPTTSPLQTQDWREIAAALRSGVSLAYEGERFEETRLAFVTGHSSDVVNHPYAAIFAGLGQARIGDEFLLSLESGESRYQVVERHQLDPTNTEAFRQLALETGPARLALVTCWPPLTTKQRLVIVGERIELSAGEVAL